MVELRTARLRPRAAVLSLALALAAGLVAPTLATAGQDHGTTWTRGVLDPGLTTTGEQLQQVVVSGVAGSAEAVRAAVRAVGGTVGGDVAIVDGVEAQVPAGRLPELAGTPGVAAVTADRAGAFSTISYDADAVASGFVHSTQAPAAWSLGATGRGVGVAVIDTGISQMTDFTGRLVHGPDLSGEGRLVDTYGHGTVMAGAIGGSGADSTGSKSGARTGVAPDATLVAVKVAGANGVTDVSTVLQAMHWVSAYREQFNIRVLNLSWGVPSTQDPSVDPLNYAVQRLWQQGIVVVVAAGNSGPDAGTITKPADDPLVLTVGAYDDRGDSNLSNDAAVKWSSQGPTAQGLQKPDLVTPGRSLVLARSFGSTVEAENPKALVAPSYIRGSGTSQAAAVTSGLAALLLQARPELTPDQVKRVLTDSARPLPGVPTTSQGAGRVQLAAALTADPGPAVQQVATATGLGSLEVSRAGRHVVSDCDGVRTVIVGEMDDRCRPFDPAAWTGSTWNGSTWNGSTWNGSTWNGSTWNGSTWNGSTWNGSTWNGGEWTGSTWNGSTWNGSTWNGSTWNGSTWNGSTWNGSTWNGLTWTGGTYDAEETGLLTAWWGTRPPVGVTFPGEISEQRRACVRAVCE